MKRVYEYELWQGETEKKEYKNQVALENNLGVIRPLKVTDKRLIFFKDTTLRNPMFWFLGFFANFMKHIFVIEKEIKYTEIIKITRETYALNKNILKIHYSKGSYSISGRFDVLLTHIREGLEENGKSLIEVNRDLYEVK